MGFSEVGGDGSVAWKIDVDDEQRPGKKRASAWGRDHKDATEFTVKLKYPTSSDANNALGALTSGGMKVVGTTITFTIPVRPNSEDQIRVEW